MFDKKDKQEPKQEIKPVEQPRLEPQAPQREEHQPTVLLSQEDAYIYERLKSQPKSLEAISVRDLEKLDGKHALSLPDDLEKLFKKKGLVARWINKDKRMIARALDIRGWAIANPVLFPEIPRHHFSAGGTIERGDSILGVMPVKRAERLRQEPGKLSTQRVKNLPIEKWKEGGEQYYKPTLTEERDGEEITSGVQPDRAEQD